MPYPELAFQLGSEGTVTLQLEVDETGRVVRATAVEVKITRGSPAGARSLKEGAAKAVLRTWSFRPARQGDVSLKGALTVTVKFTRGRR